ncbi:MAG: transposase, partial [Thermodesulfobacteriota bacterium]|nr:transposase [Thermodesulfobacteriota bacterium]
IFRATEIETDKLVKSVACISDKGGVIAMTTAEKLRKEGHKEGHKEGSNKTMASMVRNAQKNGLSEEMIARIANLDITLVRKILNDEPVDIPLHLLADSEH